MNPYLEKKYNQLDQLKDYESWYLVKQETSFQCLCYLVSFLQEYINNKPNISLDIYVSEKGKNILKDKPGLSNCQTHRALRVALFFGLITKYGKDYAKSNITDTFNEITMRCTGEYEKIELYKDIVQRQIEKIFISTEIDDEYENIRKEYRLFPVMLLYKVLVELGISTGKYEISLNEYNLFIVTTMKYEEYLDTIMYIKLYRNESEKIKSEFDALKKKFDSRFIQALKQLDTLDFSDKSYIRIKKDKINEIKNKLYIYEQSFDHILKKDYFELLGSTKSLFDFGEMNDINIYPIEYIDINNNMIVDESNRKTGGKNVILYGVPGSGKSWTIQNEYCTSDTKVERVVFHPDYTNADFVGQIMPVIDHNDKSVYYEFNAGPFTNILKESYNNPSISYLLIIEEINRGNAPAIFGDIFQLLDRTSDEKIIDDIKYPIGTSEYSITNENMANIIYKNKQHKIRIPSNLSIIGTMNTSDQNVFVLDTAFQRRWSMRLVENTFTNEEFSLANEFILDTNITWKKFCEIINNLILTHSSKIASAEDKRLGIYFINKNELKYDNRVCPSNGYSSVSDELNFLLSEESSGRLDDSSKARLDNLREALMHNRLFPEKVIKYLWDDAFKFNRNDLFHDNFLSLESVIKEFIMNSGINRFNIFKSNIIEILKN